MKLPIVSICIITYNSGATILETLNSVFEQTYDNLELIIGDDASKDDTVDKCKNWMKINSERFLRTEIITSDINTGVPANCNRILTKAQGVWIKTLAGDDMLMPNCISDLIEFTRSHPQAQFIYTLYKVFRNDGHGIKIIGERPSVKFNHKMANKNQLKTYIKEGVNVTVTLFYSKSLFLRSGGFNERYKLFEDTPWIVKVLANGERLFFLDKVTFLYRVGHVSITHGTDSYKRTHFLKIPFYDCSSQFRRECIYPLMPKSDIIFWISEYSNRFQAWVVIKILKNKRTILTQIVYDLAKILNPYFFIRYVLSTFKR